MSLVIRIGVNNDPALELVVARRVAGGSEPDDENLYVVHRFDALRGQQVGDSQTIVHRYGDGAAALASRALAAVMRAAVTDG